MATQNLPAGELHYAREFKAPHTLVFRCMTEPAHLTHFWGPAGVTTPLDSIVIDLRPGGAFEADMINSTDGSRYRMQATYVEISPPERLVWTEAGSGMTTTVTFVDHGPTRSEVLIRQTNVPVPAQSPEARAGFLTSLDRFTTYLANLLEGTDAS